MELMQKANISKSIVSITSPGTHLDPNDVEFGRNLTRQCNEFAADLKRRNPDKFGFWASLPLPDVNGTLAEIEYALDVLDADGVTLETNSHGVYPGDPLMDPIFEALNKRGATIFIHPTSPVRRGGNVTEAQVPLPQYPNPIFEFFFESARTVVNLFLTGTIARSPNVTIILSHAGGALPPLISRFTAFAQVLLGSDITLEAVKKALRTQFYFDLAGFVFPDQIHGLLPYVDESRITYGSDYPYTPAANVIALADSLNTDIPSTFENCEARRLIYRKNAQEILGHQCPAEL